MGFLLEGGAVQLCIVRSWGIGGAGGAGGAGSVGIVRWCGVGGAGGAGGVVGYLAVTLADTTKSSQPELGSQSLM